MTEPHCAICNTAPKKYKCPTCSLPICSLPCFTTHRATHPPTTTTTTNSASKPLPEPLNILPPPPPPRYIKARIDFTPLTLSPRFSVLLTSQPQLLPLLRRIYAATLEPDPEAEVRRERAWDTYSTHRGGKSGRGRGRGERGRGGGGAFRGGRGGGKGGFKRKWTQKKGDEEGMRILRDVRRGYEGEEKEVLRAFAELVEDVVGGKNDIVEKVE